MRRPRARSKATGDDDLCVASLCHAEEGLDMEVLRWGLADEIQNTCQKMSLNSIFRLLLVTKFLERRHGVFTRVTKQRARRGAGPCEPALKVMYPLNWEHALLVCFERKCNIGADNVVLDTNRQCSSLYGPENQGANYNAMKIYRELGGVIWKGVAAVPPKITYKGS